MVVSTILFLQCSYSNTGFGKFSLLFSVLFLFWKFSVCVQVLQAVGRGSEVISNRITIALEASLGQIFIHHKIETKTSRDQFGILFTARILYNN